MENRKVRVILTMDVELTPHEEREALPCGPSGHNTRLMGALESAIKAGRFTLAGDAVITANAVNRFNRTYGTTYPLHSISASPPSRKEDSK